MSNPDISADVLALLHRHLPSLDHVAVLLELNSHPDDVLSAGDIAPLIRINERIAEGVLLELERASLVLTEAGGFRIAPTREMREILPRLNELYNTRPVTLVRAIYDRPSNAATSFADAFRLRKEDA